MLLIECQQDKSNNAPIRMSALQTPEQEVTKLPIIQKNKKTIIPINITYKQTHQRYL